MTNDRDANPLDKNNSAAKANMPLPISEIAKMVNHWAACPEYGYLGSPYGGRTHLQKFVAGEIESQDEVSNKIKKNIPCTVTTVDPGQIRLLIDTEELIVNI